jgi:lipoprotein-releasing system permease protein
VPFIFLAQLKIKKVNTELFIARRIVSAKENKGNISRAIVAIAIGGIAFGLVMMILAISITTGFKAEIRNKVTGFGSHISILNLDNNSSYEKQPIKKDQVNLAELKSIPGIAHIQEYGTKPCILKSKTAIHGVVLKGISKDFDWNFFTKNMVEGASFKIEDTVASNKIVVSKHVARLLNLNIGNPVELYFIQNPPRVRKLTVCGIYETGLEDYDKLFVLVDLAHIQKLNNWGRDQITGYEVICKDIKDIEPVSSEIYDKVGLKFSKDGNQLMIRNLFETNQQIFDWLDLLDMNVWIILFFMVAVAGFNMVSGLLILILERTNMIGMLKAMGQQNFSIQKIFLYNAAFLIGKGLLWGNIIGVGICLAQYYGHIIPLDAATYYVSSVPINLNFSYLLFLNLGTMIATLVMLVIPSMIISRIYPIKAIKFN